LLARQHLLHRTDLPTLGLIEHLVGLQAQAPLASYVGLWTRREGFSKRKLRDAELIELIKVERKGSRFVRLFGARKMWLHLRSKGHDVARCTVEPLMAQLGHQRHHPGQGAADHHCQ